MSGMNVRGHNPDLVTEVVANTSEVVEYTLRLELAPARWERVAEIIETAIAAGAAGDLEGVRMATDELVRSGPVRVIKPDGSPIVKAGPEIVERANVLIHTLHSIPSASTEGTAEGTVEGSTKGSNGS